MNNLVLKLALIALLACLFLGCSDNVGPERNPLTSTNAEGLFYGVITDSNNKVINNCYLAITQNNNMIGAAFRYASEGVPDEAHGGGGLNGNQLALNLRRPNLENFVITGQVNISSINQGVSIVGNITWPNNGPTYNLTVNRIGAVPKNDQNE